MEKITKKEIEKLCEELKVALIESLEIDEKEEKIKLLKVKVHNRLLRAKEEIRNIKS